MRKKLWDRLPRFARLQNRVLMVVILAFVPIYVLVWMTSQEQSSIASENANQEIRFFARTLANEQNQQIQTVAQNLITLSLIPSVRQHNSTVCDSVFSELIKQYPNYTNIGVVNAEGTVTCGVTKTNPPLNFYEQTWFQEVLATQDLVVGDYLLGNVTNLPVLPIVYPVFDLEGQFNGAVIATLSLNWLNEYIARLDLPNTATVTMVQEDKTVLVRYPENEGWIGEPYYNNTVMKVVLQQKQGIAHATGIDKKERLYGFAPLAPESSSSYIIVSLAEEVVFIELEQIRNRNLYILTIVTIFLVVMGWLGSNMIVSPVAALIQASSEVARGDLSQRVNINNSITEMNQLAATFNQMADSIERRIEARTLELTNANRQLEQQIQQRKAAERELRKNAARLRESNTALQNFAYIASHDLQEPLRKVQTFGSRLQDKYGDILGSEGQDYLRRMTSASERMQQLIRDLLSYSRVSSRMKSLTFVDLNEVAKAIQSDLESQLERTHGQISITPLPILEGDTGQLHQLFLNLVNNALKYHRPNVPPQVKIYAKPIEMSSIHDSPSGKIASYQIYVEDNGIGFEEQHTERIFGLFERLHGRDEYEGTGMGLAICRKIVERHNGTITASSELGKGSVFIVTLPVNQEA